MSETIVRRVLIQTEMEAVNSGSRPAGSTRGDGGSRAVGGGRSEARTRDTLQSREAWLARVKYNSLQMQKAAEAKAAKELHNQRMREAKIEAQYRIDMRKREAAASKGAGGPADGSRENYFSTGIGWLDKANQIGFQGFITSMTLRMAGQIGMGLVDNLQGAFSGKGESSLAGFNRFVTTGRADKGGTIESLGVMGDRIASIFGGNALFDSELRGAASMRRMGVGGAQQGIFKDRAREFTQADELRTGLHSLIDLWDQVHGKAREAAEAELESSQKRLDRAKAEFGMLSSWDRTQVLDIAKRFKGGNAVTTEEMQLLRGVVSEDSPEMKKRLEEMWKGADAQELRRLFPSLEGDVAKAQGKVDKLEPVVTINGVTFNIEASIDKLSEAMRDRLNAMMIEAIKNSPMAQFFEQGMLQKGAPGGRGGFIDN